MTYETVFRECLEATMIRDYQKFMDEVNAQPEHVFSKRFEERMQKVLQVKKKKGKLYKFTRKIVAAAAITLITLGLMTTQQKSAEAGFWDVYFIEWLEEYFTMEQGEKWEKEVEFDISQITYIPEGFELVGSEDTFTNMLLYFSDGKSDIHLDIHKLSTSKWVDSTNVASDIQESEGGRLYFYVEDIEKGSSTVSRESAKGYFYQIYGNVEKEVLVKIMDGINE
ncbi:MAG: DUF4367 domain-containing protein [Lachnospiraceae bacterium]